MAKTVEQYEESKKSRNILKNECGSKPKFSEKNPFKSEIEAVTIETDETYTDEYVQLLVLGSMMDSEIMEKCETSSSFSGDKEEFNKSVIFTNILGAYSQREQSYFMMMPQARKNVQTAITKAKTGDKSLIERYKKNLADYLNTCDYSSIYNGSDDANIYASLFSIVLDFQKKGEFGNLISDDAMKMMKCSQAIMEMMDAAYNDEARLFSDETLSDEQKNDMTAKILAAEFIKEYAYNERILISKKVQASDEYQNLEDSDDWKELGHGDGDDIQSCWENARRKVNDSMEMSYQKGKNFYSPVLMKDAAGSREYLDKITQMVKNSEVYKRLITKEGDEFKEAFYAAKNVKKDSIYESVEKVISGLSKNSRASKELSKVTENRKKTVNKYLKDLDKNWKEQFEKSVFALEKKEKTEKLLNSKFGNEYYEFILGNKFYYCGEDGKYWEVQEKNNKLELAEVNKLPEPRMLSDYKGLAKDSAKRLNRVCEKTGGCFAKEYLGAYITEMERLFTSGPDRQLQKDLKYFKRVIDEAYEQLQDDAALGKIFEAYKSISKVMDKYHLSISDNELAISVNNYIKKDMEVISEVLGKAKGNVPVTIKDLFDPEYAKALQAQKEAEYRLDSHSFRLSGDVLQGMEASYKIFAERFVLNAVCMKGYIKSTLDGRHVVEDGHYIIEDGVGGSEALGAKKIEASIKKDNLIINLTVKTGPKALSDAEQKTVKKFIDDLKLGEITDVNRKNTIAAIRKNLQTALAAAVYEDMISTDAFMVKKMPEAWMESGIKLYGGTEPDRSFNRMLDRLLTSESDEQVSEGIKMVLKHFSDMDIEKYMDLSDEMVLTDENKLSDIFSLCNYGRKIKNIMESAHKRGIAMYDDLADKAEMAEKLGRMWSGRLNMYYSPVSDYIDPLVLPVLKTGAIDAVKKEAGSSPNMSCFFIHGAREVSAGVEELAGIKKALQPKVNEAQPAVNPLNEAYNIMQAERKIIAGQCGPRPVLPQRNPFKKQIEEIVIDTEGRFSDEEIQLFVLGAMMSEDIIKTCSTKSSSSSADRSLFLKDIIFSDQLVNNSKRELSYHFAMIKARKNVQEAIKNNDGRALQEYKKNIAEYLNRSAGSHMYNFSSERNVFLTLYQLVYKLGSENKFDMAALTTQTKKLMDCSMQISKFCDKTFVMENDLMDGQITQEKKDDIYAELLTDYLMTGYGSSEPETIANIVSSGQKYLQVSNEKYLKNLKNGAYLQEITEKYKDISKNFSIQAEWAAANVEAMNEVNFEAEKKTPYYTPVIMNNPDLREEYRRKLKELVKTSATFNKLKELKDPMEIQDELNDARGGAISFDGVSSTELINNIILDMQVGESGQKNPNMVAGRKELEAVTEERLNIVKAHTDKLSENVLQKFEKRLEKKRSEANQNKALADIEKQYGIKKNENKFTIDDQDYYRIPNGRFILLESDGKNGWNKKEVNELPFPLHTADWSAYFTALNDRMNKGKKKSEIFAGNSLKTYVDALRKTAGKDGSTKLLDRLEILYSSVKNLCDQKKPLSLNEFQTVADILNESAGEILTYLEGVPENAVLKSIADYLKSDAAAIHSVIDAPLSAEPMPLTDIFSSGPINQAQNDIRDRKLPEFEMGENILPADDYVNYYQGLTGYLFHCNPELKIYPDGRFVKNENNEMYLKSGKLLKGFEGADYLKAHKDELTDLFKRNKPVVNYTLTAEIKNEIIKIFYGGKAPEAEVIAARMEKIKSLNELLERVSREKAFEDNEIYFVGNLNRSVTNIILKRSGSEQDRQWNEEMVRKLQSADKKDKKKAYEMALERLKELKPDEELLDLKNESYMTDHKKLKYVLKIANDSAEMINIFNDAKKNGVDVYSPEYDELRRNIDTMMQIGLVLKERINLFMSPISAYLPPEMLSRQKESALANYAEELKEENQPLANYLRIYSTYRDSHQMCGYVLEKEEVPTLKEFRMSVSRTNVVDSKDTGLYELRRKMKDNVRHGIFGKKKNSKLYDGVIDAIDKYLDAPAIRKETKRKVLIAVCDRYMGLRANENSRFKLIEKVKQWAVDHEPVTKEILRGAARGAIIRVIDNYARQLTDAGHTDIAETISYHDDFIVKSIFDTKGFHKFANDGPYEPDKAKFDEICKNIMAEVAEKTRDFKFLVDDIGGQEINGPM